MNLGLMRSPQNAMLVTLRLSYKGLRNAVFKNVQVFHDLRRLLWLQE